MLGKEVKPVIILDRDGVINYDSEHYIRSADDWKPIEGSMEAIARLSQAGFRIIVATNQSGLSRGCFTMDDLGAIHRKMGQAVEDANGRIDAIFFCPHADEQHCDCRKPKPGMLLEIFNRFNVAAETVIFVGDSKRDIQAAEEAGCQPVLVLTGNGRKTLKKGELPEQVRVFDDLLSFADHLAEVDLCE